VEIVFTPAKHWTSRSLLSRNTCLWGSFVVQSAKSKYFFAGDTAYCSLFKQIGAKYGPFDIGAADPSLLASR
jgi:N-acyl-phosphatidylethanolamine-hydrolysing phospholipase D